MNLSALKEKVEPNHTVLMIIDMQREYCCQGGILDKMGFDLEPLQKVAEKLSLFVENVRPFLSPIIHIKMSLLPELFSPAMKEHYGRVGLLRTPNPELSEFYGVIPESNDIIVSKYRYSAFHSTYLDKLLRAQCIKTIVVAGLATNACVESTVRDGFMLDYQMVVPEDLTEATQQEAKKWSLYNIDTFFGQVIKSEDLMNCWS